MIVLRPAILLHGALAVAAFFFALVSAARWEVVAPQAPAAAAAPAVYGSEALAHAEAVYLTRGYAEAEDALRCAGFEAVGPTRGSRLLVPGKDYEVVPHPAVRHAAETVLAPLGSGAALCHHLLQQAVHEWYREQFRL
jgi:hypothetical protein